MQSPAARMASRWIAMLPEFPRRALQVDQMEIDSALSQMFMLCTYPSHVSRISRARKVTKNFYYRDDPAFLVLQVAFLSVTVVAYGLAFFSGVVPIVVNLLSEVVFKYFAFGVLASTATWLFANKYLLTSAQMHEVRREVDWRHSFDIHCNGYFPYFVWTKVLHFVIMPAIWRGGFAAQLVGNVLFVIGVCAYFYVTFLGYLDLPSLNKQYVFMYPAVFFAVVMGLVTVQTQFSVSRWSVEQAWYF